MLIVGGVSVKILLYFFYFSILVHCLNLTWNRKVSERKSTKELYPKQYYPACKELLPGQYHPCSIILK